MICYFYAPSYTTNAVTKKFIKASTGTVQQTSAGSASSRHTDTDHTTDQTTTILQYHRAVQPTTDIYRPRITDKSFSPQYKTVFLVQTSQMTEGCLGGGSLQGGSSEAVPSLCSEGWIVSCLEERDEGTAGCSWRGSWSSWTTGPKGHSCCVHQVQRPQGDLRYGSQDENPFLNRFHPIE